MDDAHLDAIAGAYTRTGTTTSTSPSPTRCRRTETCDLCVVGGATGLWTALIAKERDPSRDVVLVEGGAVGSAASGRNGGFMESSLTHGVGNGQERFTDEMPALERLGLENLNQIEAAIGRYGIDCDYERTGVIDIAIDQSMVMELRDDAEHLHRLGQDVELLDEQAMQAEVHSPAYRAGLFPMPVERSQLGWWSPDPRGVIPLDALHVSKSLRRSLRRYVVRTDTEFVAVMLRCADPRRPHGWITRSFVDAYTNLYDLGWAHSVEAWQEGVGMGSATNSPVWAARAAASRNIEDNFILKPIAQIPRIYPVRYQRHPLNPSCQSGRLVA